MTTFFLTDLWLNQAIGAILVSSSLLCLRETMFRFWVWLKTVSEISSIRLFSKYSSWTTARKAENRNQMFDIMRGLLLGWNWSQSVIRFYFLKKAVVGGGVTTLSFNSCLNWVLLVKRSWQTSKWFVGTVSGCKPIIHLKTKFTLVRPVFVKTGNIINRQAWNEHQTRTEIFWVLL